MIKIKIIFVCASSWFMGRALAASLRQHPEQFEALEALVKLIVNNAGKEERDSIPPFSANEECPVSTNPVRLLCDDEIGVVHLHLLGLKLDRVPPELFRFSGLTYLSLFDNKIAGAFPSQIGLLSRLTSFGIGNNAVTSIPSQIGYLTELRKL